MFFPCLCGGVSVFLAKEGKDHSVATATWWWHPNQPRHPIRVIPLAPGNPARFLPITPGALPLARVAPGANHHPRLSRKLNAKPRLHHGLFCTAQLHLSGSEYRAKRDLHRFVRGLKLLDVLQPLSTKAFGSKRCLFNFGVRLNALLSNSSSSASLRSTGTRTRPEYRSSMQILAHLVISSSYRL